MPLMLKQTSLCFINTFLLLKHCNFYKSIFCFYFLFCETWIYQSLWCTRNVTCLYLIWTTNPLNFQIFDLKRRFYFILFYSYFTFIAKNIDANVAFHFKFTKFFFWHRKFHSIIIKIINKFFNFLRISFWMYFYWVNMPNMTPKKIIFDQYFWCWLVLFLNFLIQQVILCDNFQLLV